MKNTYDSHQTRRMEQVHGAPLASFWRRGAAFFLDILIMSAVFVALSASVAWVLQQLGLGPKMPPKIVFALNANWYSIAWVVAYFGLTTYFARGRSPGKALLGIRVVSLTHERLSLWHSLERALGYGASMLEFGFGFIQYFIHPNKRTVHDRIADTIVVREPRRKKGKKISAKPD